VAKKPRGNEIKMKKKKQKNKPGGNRSSLYCAMIRCRVRRFDRRRSPRVPYSQHSPDQFVVVVVVVASVFIQIINRKIRTDVSVQVPWREFVLMRGLHACAMQQLCTLTSSCYLLPAVSFFLFFFFPTSLFFFYLSLQFFILWPAKFRNGISGWRSVFFNLLTVCNPLVDVVVVHLMFCCFAKGL
jgi:hypothetical protein